MNFENWDDSDIIVFQASLLIHLNVAVFGGRCLVYEGDTTRRCLVVCVLEFCAGRPACLVIFLNERLKRARRTTFKTTETKLTTNSTKLKTGQTPRCVK